MASNVKSCERCGAEFKRPASYGDSQWHGRRFCSRPCFAIGLRLPRPFCACGCGENVLKLKNKYIRGHRPRALHCGGYVRLFAPTHPLAGRDGLVLEHRMVAYDAGLAVPPGHHVHHINGVKTDNRIENLEVLPAAEHHRHHIREAGYIVNQFGTWPLLTDEERRQKWHEGYVRRRDRLRAEKAA